MISTFPFLALLFLLLASDPGSTCPSHHFCTCSEAANGLNGEVHCFSAPFARIPNFTDGRYFRISIVSSRDIHDLDENCLGKATVSSFTLSGSKISEVSEAAFSGTEELLTTLDLSENQIRLFPTAALARLRRLQWLSLKGNFLDELKARDLVTRKSNEDGLRTLVLSDNRLTVIQDGVFSELSQLETLDLAGNMISRIEGRPFPAGLTSLSLSQNLLEIVPVQALSELTSLKWLQLRGNVIKVLPSRWFLPSSTIHILDLSHNLLSVLPESLFMSHQRNLVQLPVTEAGMPLENEVQANEPPLDYVSIGDLHLDFNGLQVLPEHLFLNVSIKRLSLSQNQLSNLPQRLFHNSPLHNGLQALDLNFNHLASFPVALKSLTRITTLFLRGNQLDDLDSDSFTSSKDSLATLDLSANFFFRLPSDALRNLTHLVRLNLHSNLIERLDERQLGPWASSLISLTLSRNRLSFISPAAFTNCHNLRELRLAHNALHSVSSESLVVLRKSLVILELTSSLAPSSLKSAATMLKDISLLNKLEWLDLDYNSLRIVNSNNASNSFTSRLPHLVHLDLDGNQLDVIDNSTFSGDVPSKLRRISIADSRVAAISPGAFSDLPNLVKVSLSGNNLKKIASNSFMNLPLVQSINLDRNKIKGIEEGAFCNLSRLASVQLQGNQLTSFSMQVFGRPEMSDDQTDDEVHFPASLPASLPASPLYINVSHNEITELASKSSGNWQHGRNGRQLAVLDASYNNLSRIPSFASLSSPTALLSLHLSFNFFSSFSIHLLHNCSNLESLTLNNNLITCLTNTTIQNSDGLHCSSPDAKDGENKTVLPSLLFLDLSHNLIKNFKDVTDTFLAASPSLRVLDLSYNKLQTVSNVVVDTIEKLILAGNQLTQVQINYSFGRNSLRVIDLSHNLLRDVPDSISSSPQLASLDVSHNRILDLSDLALSESNQLKELLLAGNRMHNLRSRFLIPLSKLELLDMSDCGLNQVLDLPLPKLQELRLAGNGISNTSSHFLSKCRRVKTLDLSRNLFADVPRNLWRFVPGLVNLNVSSNPIEVLDTTSLNNLLKLRQLDISKLVLKYIDTRLLHHFKHLLSLTSSTYPSVRSFRFQDLLAKSLSLRYIGVHVQEETLSHQIQWAFGPKVKEIVISGTSLVNILPDAFLGLQSSGLVIRVIDTSVRFLPPGLVRFLGNRLSVLDLRANQLTAFNSHVLYSANKDMHSAASMHPHLMVLLDRNPLVCSCDLLWYSKWLRIRNKEIARLHAMDVNPSSGNTLDASCQRSDGRGELRAVQLSDLRPETLTCSSQSTATHLATSFSKGQLLVIFGCIITCFWTLHRTSSWL